MARYAQHTKVPIERSRTEIERTLERYGAESFMSGWDKNTGQDVVGFVYRGSRIQLSLRRPDDDPDGRDGRQRWRALLLVIKAKLEAVDSGISTFQEEFLAWVIMPNGATLGSVLVPKLEMLSRHGLTDRMLPPPVVSANGESP